MRWQGGGRVTTYPFILTNEDELDYIFSRTLNLFVFPKLGLGYCPGEDQRHERGKKRRIVFEKKTEESGSFCRLSGTPIRCFWLPG